MNWNSKAQGNLKLRKWVGIIMLVFLSVLILIETSDNIFAHIASAVKTSDFCSSIEKGAKISNILNAAESDNVLCATHEE